MQSFLRSLTALPSRLASPLRPLFPFLPPPPLVSTPRFPGSCGLLVESPELQGRRLTENAAWGRHQLVIAPAPATVGFCPEAEHVPFFHRDPTRADGSWGGETLGTLESGRHGQLFLRVQALESEVPWFQSWLVFFLAM